MKIDPDSKSYIPLKGKQSKTDKSKEEKVATQFEMLFAQQLVGQLTKGLFKMDDKNNMLGQANSMYRYYITDSLASELAKNHRLGIANMLLKNWNKTLNEKVIKPEDS